MSSLMILLLPAVLAVPAVYAGQKNLRYREYLKVSVTLSLLFIVLLNPSPADSLAEWLKSWFVVSLFFAAAADFLLSNQRRSWFFLAGLCGFFVAYSLYGLSLHRAAGLQPVTAFAIIPLIIVMIVSYRSLTELPEGLRIPVLCYMLMVSHLVLASIAFFFSAAGLQAGLSVRALFLGGAMFIFISDSIIAQAEFRRPMKLGEFWILSTYYVAQISMVGGFLLLA